MPKFISDAEMANLEAPTKRIISDQEMSQLEQQDSGAGQAALEGFGQTASLGYLPQLQAGTEKGISGIQKLLGVGPAAVDEQLRQQGFQLPEEPSYTELRDINIARHAQQAQQHPKATMAGKAAGIGAQMLLPAGAAAKGASIGQKAIQGAKMGAIQGAAYNPGDTAGQVDPLQLPERAMGAAIGGTVGGVAGAATGAIEKGARLHRRVKQVQSSENLSKEVKKEINQAVKGLNEQQIKPRIQSLKELIKGKKVDINPERLQDISPGLDRYAQTLSKKVDPKTGRATIDATRAQRLKQLLDRRADYAVSKPHDLAAVAKGEEAKKAADILRDKISSLDPKVGQLNKEASEFMRYRDELLRKSRTTPISAIKGGPGTDKGSLIDAIDKAAGSNLEKTSREIEFAKELQPNYFKLAKPLEAPAEVLRGGLRMGLRGTAALEKAPPTSRPTLQMLLEAKRKKEE